MFCWLDVFSLRLIAISRAVTFLRLESQLYAVVACADVVCAIVVCAAGADKAAD